MFKPTIEVPTYDRLRYEIIPESDAILALEYEPDLEFEVEPTNGDILYFTNGSDEEPMVFCQAAIDLETVEPGFLVACNVLDSPYGGWFPTIEAALKFGRELAANSDFVALLNSVLPTNEEIVRRMKDSLHDAAIFKPISKAELKHLIRDGATTRAAKAKRLAERRKQVHGKLHGRD